MSKPWQPLLVLCSYNSNGSSSYRRSIIDTKAKDKWCIWWSIDYSARVLQSCSNSSLLVIIMSCCVDNDGSFFTSIIRQDQGVWWWCQHCKWSIIHHLAHNCRWLGPALSSMRDLQFQSPSWADAAAAITVSLPASRPNSLPYLLSIQQRLQLMNFIVCTVKFNRIMY